MKGKAILERGVSQTKTTEKGPLTKEPDMKRGERGTETYKKATKEAKSTKKRRT